MLEILLGSRPIQESPGVLSLVIEPGNDPVIRLQIRDVTGYVTYKKPGQEDDFVQEFSAGASTSYVNISPEDSVTDIDIYTTPGNGGRPLLGVIGNTGANDRIVSVKDWSSVSEKVQLLFASSKLTSVPNTAPKQSIFSALFRYSSNFNQNLNNWDVSHVTSMEAMFFGCSKFNQPLNNWNTHNLVLLNNMFNGCIVFNQPLSNWDVSNVTTMTGLFRGCVAFNQPLNNWNTSRVTNMSYVFSDCSIFNQSIANWDVSKVSNLASIFANCKVYNQNISNMIFKSTAVRTNYDAGTTAWLSVNKPKFTGV